MDKIEFNKYNFKENNLKLEVLDEFNKYYEWEVFKNGYNYILYDNQTGELIEMYDDFYALVIRISSRALDYYCEEQEYDEFSINDYKYIMQFVFIYDSYNGFKESDWLKDKKKFLKDMEVKY